MDLFLRPLSSLLTLILLLAIAVFAIGLAGSAALRLQTSSSLGWMWDELHIVQAAVAEAPEAGEFGVLLDGRAMACRHEPRTENGQAVIKIACPVPGDLHLSRVGELAAQMPVLDPQLPYDGWTRLWSTEAPGGLREWGWRVLVVTVLTVLPFMLLVWPHSWRKDFDLLRAQPLWLLTIPAMPVAYAFVVLAVLVASGDDLFGGLDDTSEGKAGLQILWRALITTGWITLVTAVVEELVFRGFLYRHLIVKAGPWATCIITSLCFALVHQDQQMPGRDLFEYTADHLLLWIQTFIAGLMYFVIRHFSGSLILVVLIHLCNNAVVVALSAAMP